MTDLPDFTSRPVNEKRAKFLRKLVWIVSAAVLLLVGAMRSPYKIGGGELDLSLLPRVHAGLNTIVAVCLLAALWSIIRKSYRAHQRWMTAALVFSGFFLLSYVAYHFTTVETLYGDFDGSGDVSDAEKSRVGGKRTAYLILLLTHIVAAAVSFPLILLTFVHAWSHDFAKHKKLARKVYPVWLFVAITGPICYWMLKPFY